MNISNQAIGANSNDSVLVSGVISALVNAAIGGVRNVLARVIGKKEAKVLEAAVRQAAPMASKAISDAANGLSLRNALPVETQKSRDEADAKLAKNAAARAAETEAANQALRTSAEALGAELNRIKAKNASRAPAPVGSLKRRDSDDDIALRERTPRCKK